MTQASIFRSSTRAGDRVNTRTRRESDCAPEESALVSLDRDQVSRNNSIKSKLNNIQNRINSSNGGIVSSNYNHNLLLGAPNGGAITRV